MDSASTEDMVIDAVWEVIESILLKSRDRFTTRDHLVHDLKISSDDLSFIFVPELERRLGINIPVSEWDNVGTVQEAIDLLKRYKNHTQ